MGISVLIFLFSSFLISFVSSSSPVIVIASSGSSSSPSFRAAALQFSPIGDPQMDAKDVNQIKNKNLEGLVKMTTTAALEQGAELVAWSEGAVGMFTSADNRDSVRPFCEDIPLDENPCLNSTYYNNDSFSQIYTGSCLARSLSIYLQIDICDVKPNHQYNTIVVFDTNGLIVARYHKAHLFGESSLFDEAAPVPTTFTASFKAGNVTFGVFVCFDIMYPHPALDLVSSGVRHFVSSIDWTNVPPSIFATATQQAWSRQNKVALIAANAASSVGQSGGGIYVSGVPLATWFDPFDLRNDTQVIIVADVPVQIDDSDMEEKNKNEVAQLSGRVTEEVSYVNCVLGLPPVLLSSFANLNVSLTTADNDLLPIGNCSLFSPPSLSSLSSSSINVAVSHRGLDCALSFDWGSTVNSTDTFAAIAYKGQILFKETIDPLSLEVCGIITCSPTAIIFGTTLCQAVYMSSTVISSFSITGSNFGADTLILPELMLGKVQVTNKEAASYREQTTTTTTTTAKTKTTRTAEWTNTNQNKIQDTWYGAALVGIVPN